MDEHSGHLVGARQSGWFPQHLIASQKGPQTMRHISHTIRALLTAQPSQEAVRAALIVSYQRRTLCEAVGARSQGYTLDNAMYLASK